MYLSNFISGGKIISILLIGVLLAILTAFPLYMIYKKANLKNPWIAFIPFFGSFKTLNLANLSMFALLGVGLISLIPFLGTLIALIFGIWLNYTVCKNFGLGTLGCIIGIFFATPIYWYIALSKTTFVAELNPKYTN